MGYLQSEGCRPARYRVQGAIATGTRDGYAPSPDLAGFATFARSGAGAYPERPKTYALIAT